jgi:hypothetical protein
MADQNDLNQPSLSSRYDNQVLETIRGHVLRLWKGDYTGMGNLVTGIRRWVRVGTTNVKLVERNVSGGEDTLFDSSLAALKDGSNATGTWPVSISGNAATATSAVNATNATNATTAAACSGNAASATTAAACSGNAASATTAAACTGNAATATTATNVTNALGSGQTWQSVSRSLGVTYTNTTGKPIQLAVTIQLPSQNNAYVSLVIAGVTIGYVGDNSASQPSLLLPVHLIIPNGVSYSINTAVGSPSINNWYELR